MGIVRIVTLCAMATLTGIIWHQSHKLDAAITKIAEQASIIEGMGRAAGAAMYQVQKAGEELAQCKTANDTLAQVDQWLSDELRTRNGSLPPCLQASNSTRLSASAASSPR